MFVFLLLIALVNQSARGSPFNFPDEVDSSNKENREMILPGIYLNPSAKSGKSLNIEENPRAVPISFGSSEPVVRLPSLASIMFSSSSSSRVNLPKRDEPKPVHGISFGDEPIVAAINFNDGTADKTDAAEVNVPMIFFDDRQNNIPIVTRPVPATFDVPVINNFNKLENEKELALQRGFPVVIVIEDTPIEAFLHFINSTTDHDNIQNDTNFIQTSSESPEVLFLNPMEDESSNDDVESSHFRFPTPKTTDVTEDNQRSPVILNSPNINTCESGFMFYNDTCYQLLTSGPCGNNSWLISKDGYSAECEQRQCAVKEIFFNNSCVDSETPNICPEGSKLKMNQSGVGYCQSECTNGHMFYQGECYRFLESGGPCGKENWLILRDLNNAECAPRPCPFGEILYNNKCVDPSNSTVCASGQMLYVDLTGDAFCDCEPDFIYIPLDGKCIPEYEQGYCEWGDYLVRNEDEIPECVRNPCGKDHSVYHNGTDRCYTKKYIGFCEEEFLLIKEEDAECGEIELDLRNIFEVPTLRRCPRGSVRDVLHECRRRFTMPSMSSVLTAKHLYGGCKPGWTKGPNRKCKKIRNLFG